MIPLMMDAVSISETPASFYETTRHSIPEDSHVARSELSHTLWGGDKWVWNNGGMMISGESVIARKNICSSVTSSTTNHSRSDPVMKPGLTDEKPVCELWRSFCCFKKSTATISKHTGYIK
jgi:hypothetical protein